MKTTIKTLLVLVPMTVGLLLISRPVFAHHGTANVYDNSKAVMMKGTITKFEWTNPHNQIYFDVKDASGKIANWAIEMNSPGVLRAAGWTKTTFKVGDQITITVRPAKAGTPVGLINRSQPIIVNGKQVLAGDRTANAIN